MLFAATFSAVLTITLFPQGTDGPRREWVVRCPGAAPCARLEEGGRALFLPTPRGILCTDIYGGPQVAYVRGTLDGRRVWARFGRSDGCQIARWSRISFLLRR
jgi:hypothetical protein